MLTRNLADLPTHRRRNRGYTPMKALVFYDGECPLCRREIDHYRSIRGANQIRWVDISREKSVLHAYGLDYEAAMARLHVKDRRGNWHIGAYAFAELWSHLAGYRWLALASRSLNLLPMVDRAYSRFARWRAPSYCSIEGGCATTPGNSARESR